MRPLPAIPFACGRFLWGRYELTVSRTPMEGDGVLRLDEEKIPACAEVRTRREGDTFHKFGGGRKSLKKYLIDIKLAKRQREGLPLLADGEEILAVFGVEISERVKCTDESTKIIYLSMKERE